jgi:hypothetical protein
MRCGVVWLIQSDPLEPFTDVFPSFAISTEIFLFQTKVTNTHSPPAKLSPPKSATARKPEPVNQNTSTDTDSTSMWGKKVPLSFYYFRHKYWIMVE